jgi:hypothetical protein
LPEKEAWGRRLFHDARDPLLSGGMACAGCHPDGRDDGHVWLETKSPITTMSIFVTHQDMVDIPVVPTRQETHARQTPMLAGRITPEGPYGWHAQNAFLSARVLDGFMLHRWKGTTVARDARTRIDAIAAFARAGLVPPARDEHPATPEEARGQELFSSEQVGCAGCHVPQTMYTNKAAYPITPWKNFVGDEDPEPFRTPPLLFVGGTPPYYHDGSALTLEQLIDENGDRMGHTGQLTPADRRALVAFLKTL